MVALVGLAKVRGHWQVTELKCAMEGGMTLSSDFHWFPLVTFSVLMLVVVSVPLPAPGAVRAPFMPRQNILARFRCPPDFNVSGLYHALQEKHVLDSRHMVGGVLRNY